MDLEKLLPIFVGAGYFISAFAAITAGVIMIGVQKRFGTGILASGFKFISIGVLLIAAGIVLEAIQSYIQIPNNPTTISILLLAKEALFAIGAYAIVIGSKKTGDKLESLTK